MASLQNLLAAEKTSNTPVAASDAGVKMGEKAVMDHELSSDSSLDSVLSVGDAGLKLQNGLLNTYKKTYKCSTCGKECPSKQSFGGHQNVHRSERKLVERILGTVGMASRCHFHPYYLPPSHRSASGNPVGVQPRPFTGGLLARNGRLGLGAGVNLGGNGGFPTASASIMARAPGRPWNPPKDDEEDASGLDLSLKI